MCQNMGWLAGHPDFHKVQVQKPQTHIHIFYPGSDGLTDPGSTLSLLPVAIVRAKPRKTLEMTIPINSHLWFNPISAAKGFKAFQVLVSLYLSLFLFSLRCSELLG